MGKVVMWAIIIVWLACGLFLLIGCLGRKSTEKHIEEHPWLMASICVVGGPLIMIYGVISTIIEMVNGRKK